MDSPPPSRQDVTSDPGTPLLSVIIANYNARDLLRQCLRSLFEHAPSCSFDVYVIDDASRDGSYEMVAHEFPQVRLLRNERNLHYARSNNQVFARSRATYFYLLNSDTLILPGALDKMVAFLEAHPETGAVGNKLFNEDGSVQASVKTLPSIASGFFGWRSPLTKLFPTNRFSRKHLLHLSEDMSKPFQAGYVSSASVLIPRHVVEKVGPLDPRLSYHVDADYCARIWEAGWNVYYLPDAPIIHLDHKGGTLAGPRRRFKAVVEFHRGSFIYFQKHQMKGWWHPMTAVVVLGLAARFLVALTLQQLREIGRPRARGPGASSMNPDASQPA